MQATAEPSFRSLVAASLQALRLVGEGQGGGVGAVGLVALERREDAVPEREVHGISRLTKGVAFDPFCSVSRCTPRCCHCCPSEEFSSIHIIAMFTTFDVSGLFG